MPQPWYDPGSKWLIAEHGASLLHIAGLRSITSCIAKPAEVVQPRKLPDGLLEVRFGSSLEVHLVLAEVATYPEQRVVEQISDDIRLVRQVKGVLPDAIVFCLAPKGQYRIAGQIEVPSKLGWTTETLCWKVLELWTIPAEQLLSAPGIGAVPWATLCQYNGPPEVLLQRCRTRIDKEGGEQHANLIALTQVFARMHYNEPKLLEIIGGKNAMIDAPIIQELLKENGWNKSVELILSLLADHGEEVDPNISAGLAQVKDDEKLKHLLKYAARCSSTEDFAAELRKALPEQKPPSTRRSKGSKKPK